MDFRRSRLLGDGLCGKDPQLLLCQGYDHNLIFPEGQEGRGSAVCPRSGIRLDMTTSQPAVQLYTGNYVDGDKAPCGKGGVPLSPVRRLLPGDPALSLQPQLPPVPHHGAAGGRDLRERTVYRFSVERD